MLKLCKEIQENNRMGKNRDLFKKIRDTQGTLHAKMGTIRGRKDMDITEVEDIKKRWKEYTELNKKILMTRITTMVWSLFWSVKWALGRITTWLLLSCPKLVDMMGFQLNYLKS